MRVRVPGFIKHLSTLHPTCLCRLIMGKEWIRHSHLAAMKVLAQNSAILTFCQNPRVFEAGRKCFWDALPVYFGSKARPGEGGEVCNTGKYQ